MTVAACTGKCVLLTSGFVNKRVYFFSYCGPDTVTTASDCTSDSCKASYVAQMAGASTVTGSDNLVETIYYQVLDPTANAIYYTTATGLYSYLIQYEYIQPTTYVTYCPYTTSDKLSSPDTANQYISDGRMTFIPCLNETSCVFVKKNSIKSLVLYTSYFSCSNFAPNWSFSADNYSTTIANFGLDFNYSYLFTVSDANITSSLVNRLNSEYMRLTYCRVSADLTAAGEADIADIPLGICNGQCLIFSDNSTYFGGCVADSQPDSAYNWFNQITFTSQTWQYYTVAADVYTVILNYALADYTSMPVNMCYNENNVANFYSFTAGSLMPCYAYCAIVQYSQLVWQYDANGDLIENSYGDPDDLDYQLYQSICLDTDIPLYQQFTGPTIDFPNSTAEASEQGFWHMATYLKLAATDAPPYFTTNLTPGDSSSGWYAFSDSTPRFFMNVSVIGTGVTPTDNAYDMYQYTPITLSDAGMNIVFLIQTDASSNQTWFSLYGKGESCNSMVKYALKNYKGPGGQISLNASDYSYTGTCIGQKQSLIASGTMLVYDQNFILTLAEDQLVNGVSTNISYDIAGCFSGRQVPDPNTDGFNVLTYFNLCETRCVFYTFTYNSTLYYNGGCLDWNQDIISELQNFDDSTSFSNIKYAYTDVYVLAPSTVATNQYDANDLKNIQMCLVGYGAEGFDEITSMKLCKSTCIYYRVNNYSELLGYHALCLNSLSNTTCSEALPDIIGDVPVSTTYSFNCLTAASSITYDQTNLTYTFTGTML